MILWKEDKMNKDYLEDASMTHYIFEALEELEKDVVSLYPNKKDLYGKMHYTVFGYAVTTALNDGVNKEALLEVIDGYYDFCSKLDEFNEGKSYAH
jgi:hypothetical protein